MQVADRLIGYLVVESATPGFFTADHADRLGAIADQAGAALSNSQLARRVSELAATEERQRLARDLHDAVNQTLWTAALTAESLLNDIDPRTRSCSIAPTVCGSSIVARWRRCAHCSSNCGPMSWPTSTSIS